MRRRSSFGAADSRLANPLVAAARFVPGLAQHHRVVTELSSEAADAARFLSIQLDAVDLDRLSVTDGRIDIAQVRALQTPLSNIQQRVETLQARVAEIDSPWLLSPVDDRIDDLAIELAAQHRRSEDALTVALAAPRLLGGDGTRTYYIGFTTPSEARGSGGFMGNWAEMTVTDGQIEMTKFGRSDDLNLAGDPTARRFSSGDASGLDEWAARYGPFNLTSGPGGTTGSEPWKNINMSPDIATTGKAIADLYPQSGGGQLDGVFMMDVYTLARFLEFTGPIPLPEGAPAVGADEAESAELTADTAANYLLHEQYDLTKVDARVDVLENFSRSVIDTLLGGTLPAPTTLIDTLGPMVDQGRFTGWMSRPDDQAVLEQIGMSGTLLDPGTGDGVALALNNAAGNKIDYYLDAAGDLRRDRRCPYRHHLGPTRRHDHERRAHRGRTRLRDRQPGRAPRRHQPHACLGVHPAPGAGRAARREVGDHRARLGGRLLRDVGVHHAAGGSVDRVVARDGGAHGRGRRLHARHPDTTDGCPDTARDRRHLDRRRRRRAPQLRDASGSWLRHDRAREPPARPLNPGSSSAPQDCHSAC